MRKRARSAGRRGARYRHLRRQRKKQIFCTAAICLCCIGILAVLFYQHQMEQKEMQVQAEHSYNTGSGYRDIVYNGKKYRYNTLIRTILYAGIDSTGEMQASLQYGNKARADVISLVILDKKHETMTILPLSRDTMTEVRRYSLNGNDNGLYTTHLGYAYSYGDGGKVSCENLCEAVSNLLGGIPVREYVVTNQDSMPYMNDLVGGITVKVPNDDLEEEYPELYQGAEIFLTEETVSPFLQYRDTEEDFSNEGRMERQKAYVTAYIEKVKQMGEEEMEELWNSLESMEGFLQTSITKNQYLEYYNLLQKTVFSEESFETVEGEDQAGELHDEFYPDEEKLQEQIIRLFYDEV